MKTIDAEIRVLEQRMAQRRHEVADTARLAKSRALRKLLSPTGLATAAGLGFLATLGLTRRRHAAPPSGAAAKAGKAAGLIRLVLPVALALFRAQFGGPAGLAQFVLSKMQKRSSPAGDGYAAPRRPVHPAR